MALTRREQAQYDALRAKRGTPRKAARPPTADQDDDEGVYVLAGRHADSFLDRLFGPSSSNGHAAADTDDDQDDDDQDDDDQDDDDQDDDDQDDQDDAPPPANRFFRSGRAR
jgi:hypothetical protein